MRRMKPDYGIDAPGLVRNLLLCGILLPILGLLFPTVRSSKNSSISESLCPAGAPKRCAREYTGAIPFHRCESCRWRSRRRSPCTRVLWMLPGVLIHRTFHKTGGCPNALFRPFLLSLIFLLSLPGWTQSCRVWKT